MTSLPAKSIAALEDADTLTLKALALTREQAARLCGLAPTGFDVWVRKGIVPGPVKGTRRWSRVALERALGGEVPANDDAEETYRRWKESRVG
jgi:hypothetical protein